MKSLSAIMADVNAEVAASRFTHIVCSAAPVGGAPDGTKLVKETRTVTRFRGLGRAARELGVSRGHLSYVLHGQRKPGKDLEKKLRRMGIRLGEEAAV